MRHNNFMVERKNGNITVANRCPMCNKIHTVDVNDVDFQKWQAGVSIQIAFPYLSADEREILMTGTCSKCWDKIFSIEEDEEEDENITDLMMESLEMTGLWW